MIKTNNLKIEAMAKNIDLIGNEVKTGDIMLEVTGGGSLYKDDPYIYSIKLWEVPEILDGRGHYYTIDNEKRRFYWASIQSSIKINTDLTPENFMFSFYHSMWSINSKIKDGTAEDIINSSNWKSKEVKKEQVDRFEFMKNLKIETLDDIKNNIKELKKNGYVPHKIVSNVLNIAKVGRVPVHNGEIGIAAMYDQMRYQEIIELVSKDPNCFLKAEVDGQIK